MDIARAIHEFLREIFRHGGNAMDSKSVSAALGYVIIVVAIAACVAALVGFLRRAGEFKRESRRLIKGASTIEENLDSQGWRFQAGKLASAQDYRGACRAA